MPDIKTVIHRYNDFLKRLPQIVADEMIDWVLDNFDSESFEGKAWPARKDRDSSRKLLVKSGRGRSSIRVSQQTAARVTVTTDLDYMIAHNDGAEITINITPRMRRFFWAMHYQYEYDKGAENKLKIPESQVKWKWMALMSGPITFRMPQRQFFGDSKELDNRIKEGIEFELKKVFR